MNLESKIYVAGHRGLAGSAIVRELQRRGYRNLVTRTHAELDLEDAAATQQFFEQEQPELVFLAAARVGGIHANNVYPVDFLMSNLLIEANICRAAHANGVARLIFLGSSCIYPRDCPQPIKEEYLLTGPLEATNRPYALAKIAGVEMCWAYNRQYGTKWLAAMPTNLYGPGDNYDLNNSHVLPALIRKLHLAKLAHAGDIEGINLDEAAHGSIPADLKASLIASAENSPLRSKQGAQRATMFLGEDPCGLTTHHSPVVLWGSGTPRREFLYVDDLANALVFLATLEDECYNILVDSAQCPLINVGSGEDLNIRELAETVSEVVGYQGGFVQDTSKPDGTMRKIMDVSKMRNLGWKPEIALEAGIALAYEDMLSRV
ncbi:GDP-L-fucose synthase family protein [Gallionella capsiferriformans]|nr:GDP-L-fucose synthase [Gallionella capsiferriformans]